MWYPRSEVELREAAERGLLEERHQLELKREISPGPGANKELACDLASMAVDGGLLIVGVDEGPPLALHPVPLAGLAERIEQVAASAVHKALTVRIERIPSAADPNAGYLVVLVPGEPARASHGKGSVLGERRQDQATSD